MNQINIFNKTKKDLIENEEILIDLFDENNVKEIFSIIFVGKREIKQLNKSYRNINKVTDVLSFSSDEEKYIGDIFICYEQAVKQAKKYKHSFTREIAFLAVHGYLHLKGYDHQTKEDEKIMIDLQEQMLNKAGIKRD